MLKQLDAWPRWIVVMTGAAVFTGLLTFAVWAVAGEQVFLSSFIGGPGSVLLIALSAIALLFSILAFCSFRPGEPLRRGWFLIASSSLCHFAAALASQIVGRHSWLNVGGPLWIALLAAGLWLVVRVYRRAGLWAGLKWTDWVALVVTAGFAGVGLAQVLSLLQAGEHLTVHQMADLANGPLLALLTLEAVLIRRSVMAMGHGLVARCWGAFVAGILLTFLGNVGIWATDYGYLHMPLAGLIWYIWFPATAAFALGPLYQAIALRRVQQSRPAPAASAWSHHGPLLPTGTSPRNA